MELTTKDAETAFDDMMFGLGLFDEDLARQCSKPGHRARFIAMLRQVAQTMEG